MSATAWRTFTGHEFSTIDFVDNFNFEEKRILLSAMTSSNASCAEKDSLNKA